MPQCCNLGVYKTLKVLNPGKFRLLVKGEILQTWAFSSCNRHRAWYPAENTKWVNKKAIEIQWLGIKLVEMRGIEPLTSALRTLRSPN
jgi:hypothetical protein